MFKIVGLGILVSGGFLLASNFSAAPTREIPWGWYERADSSAIGSGITSWNMSRGETGVRCMCAGDEGTREHTGFWVRDTGDTFVVVKAPKGYGDTVGRKFKQEKKSCLNCAD